ncbi:MAG TPA: flagellar biosynthetic protein FliO [Kofleriaceae bacterium]|nr:flagellar biosynthetic protein FliO [Kofleriaceae bacterium]
MRALALMILLSGAAIAHAEPSFEVLDRGTAVEVIAHDVKAARTAILPLRQRLQVPIVGAQTAKRITPSDPTVKLVELDSEDAMRVLSVKLSFERNDVKTLSRFAQAIQVGDDLHVIVPRVVPTDGVAPKLPEPTLSPAAAAAVAKADLKPQIALGPTPNPAAPPEAPKPASAIPSIAPNLGPLAVKPPEAVKPAEPAPVKAVEPPKPEAKPEAKLDAKPEVKVDAKPEPSEKVLGPQPDPHAHLAQPEPAKHGPADHPADRLSDHLAEPGKPAGKPDDRSLDHTLAPSTDTGWGSVIMYAVLGAGALAAGVWQVRRKRGPQGPLASIEILAQRSLGGRARLVWLTAGPHELLVAVTAQQINLLGQWPRSMPGAELEHASFADTMAAASTAPAATAHGTAQAAGIGRLTGFGPASAYAAAAGTKPARPSQTVSQPLPPLPPLRAKRPSLSRDTAVDVDVEHEPPPARPVSRPLPPVSAPGIDEPAKPSRPAIVLPPSPAAETRPRRPSVRAVEPPPRPRVVSDDFDGEIDAAAPEAGLPDKAIDKATDKAHSPAVDGILRLRGQAATKPSDDDDDDEGALDAEAIRRAIEREHAGEDPDDDDAPPPRVAATVTEGDDDEAAPGNDPEADQAWIKDILAATGANR